MCVPVPCQDLDFQCHMISRGCILCSMVWGGLLILVELLNHDCLNFLFIILRTKHLAMISDIGTKLKDILHKIIVYWGWPCGLGRYHIILSKYRGTVSSQIFLVPLLYFNVILLDELSFIQESGRGWDVYIVRSYMREGTDKLLLCVTDG